MGRLRQRHMVVFVKAPRIGAVKTRLGAGIGAAAAQRFYRDTTRELLRQLDCGRWRLWLAVHPDRFATTGAFWPRRLPRIPQGPGNIGQRMARAVRGLPSGPALVIGSDIPGILPAHIDQAFAALAKAEVVVGPARDGGFWLIGYRRGPVLLSRLNMGLEDNIRWSTEFALADTLAAMDPRFAVARLDVLADVDTAADLIL